MFDIIGIVVKQGMSAEQRGEKIEEITAYLYGRSFYLTSRPEAPGLERFYFVVESRSTAAILARLGSGMLWGSVATPEQREDIGL